MTANPSKPARKSAPDDYDGPWKEALELYFPQALALLVPKLHAAISWSVPAQFLDKELQSVARLGKKGRRFVDKLARVRLVGGADAWLLLHVEVQGWIRNSKDHQAFTWRMCEYNFLLRLRATRADPPNTAHVYSLGIFTEGDGPDTHLVYDEEYQDQRIYFSFPVINLEVWRDRLDELEALAPSNPFAVVVMAQLEANRYPDKTTRLKPKFELVQRLKGYGYSLKEASQIYRLVDWMITLPDDMEEQYQETLQALSRENEMTYITTTERWAMKKGLQQGQAELLLRQIQRRFGPVDDGTTDRVNAATAPQLELWALNILDATTLDDVFCD